MYKLPLFNLHNVQQYKLFGILKGLADLKMKILSSFTHPFCSCCSEPLWLFLNVNLNFALALTQRYCMALEDCIWKYFIIWKASALHFYYIEKKISYNWFERHEWVIFGWTTPLTQPHFCWQKHNIGKEHGTEEKHSREYWECSYFYLTYSFY